MLPPRLRFFRQYVKSENPRIKYRITLTDPFTFSSNAGRLMGIMGGAAAPPPPSLRIQSCGWTANDARLATDPPNPFLASNRISMVWSFRRRRPLPAKPQNRNSHTPPIFLARRRRLL
jgi:hypothetical protein